MPDENGTRATRSDAPSADNNLFADAAEPTAASVVDEQDANDAPPPTSRPRLRKPNRTAEVPDDAGEQAAGEEPEASEDLKVVVSLKGGRATIGVQQPSSDPHIETFDDLDVSGPDAGGLGGARKGEGQVGRRAQASRLRETRSTGQAPEPTRTGGGAGGVSRNVGGDAGTTADAEAVLGRTLPSRCRGA